MMPASVFTSSLCDSSSSNPKIIFTCYLKRAREDDACNSIILMAVLKLTNQIRTSSSLDNEVL
jgi:hypothetical protein